MAYIIRCIRAAVQQNVIAPEDGKALEKRVREIQKVAKTNAAVKEQIMKEIHAEAQERQRRALLFEESRKRVMEVLSSYRDRYGNADLPEAFVRMHENFGREGSGGSFVQDAQSLFETIRRGSQEKLATLLMENGKAAITGDLRRSLFKSQKARLDNIVRELFGENTGDAKAKAIAMAWKEVSEQLRQDFNALGGGIGKLEGWGLPQGHDKQALLDYGREKWIAYMKKDGVLDRERTVNPVTRRALSDAELEETLGVIWDRITSDGWVYKEVTGASMGRGELWSQHADHRFLHFKNADAWIAYAKDFGNPDTFAAMMHHINTMSRDIAHMRIWGPNPALMREHVKQWLMQQSALIRPTEVVIREQGLKMKDLASRLSSPNPDFKDLVDKMEQNAIEWRKLRDQINTAREAAVAPEREALRRRRSTIDKIADPISTEDAGALRQLLDMREGRDGMTPAQVLESHLMSIGITEAQRDYILGPQSTFREPGSLRASSRRTAVQMQAMIRDVLGATAERSAIDKRLAEINARLKGTFAEEGSPQRKRQDELMAEHYELARKLIPYWDDPSKQSIEDHEIRRQMEDLAEEMRDPILFAKRKKPQDYLSGRLDRADAMWTLQRGSLQPVNATFANIMASIRNLISSSTLGGAWLSSLNDPAFGQGVRMRFGMGMARSNAGTVMAKVLTALITQGSKEDAIAARLGLDSALEVMHRTARQNRTFDARGWTGFLADRVLTIGILTPWTQAGKHVIGLDIQRFIAGMTDKTWLELGKGMRDAMTTHGLDRDSWEALRGVTQYEPKTGVRYLRPAEIEAEVGRDLAERYTAMILRETRFAVPESTVASRSVLTRNPPGTIVGEAFRSGVQFKGFAIAIAMLYVNRIAREIMAGDRSAMGQAATLLITSSILAGMAMALKDVSAGRDPRRWLDEKTYLDPNFWGAAVLQAGGLGIYGDFLFSNVGRHGGGLQSTLAGPLVDRLDNLKEMTIGNANQVMQGKKTHFGRDAVRFVRTNTPGANLFWTSLVFNRVIMDTVQRYVAPEDQASFNRQIMTRRKDYGQEFYWPPGEPIPRRAPDFSRMWATR